MRAALLAESKVGQGRHAERGAGAVQGQGRPASMAAVFDAPATATPSKAGRRLSEKRGKCLFMEGDEQSKAGAALRKTGGAVALWSAMLCGTPGLRLSPTDCRGR